MKEPTGRPPGFTYRAVHQGLGKRGSPEQSLHCDQVSLTRLADRYGTPLYVYSASTIRERARRWQRAFGKFPHSLCYSVKANSNLSILQLLAGLGCGFDVVSRGELERVLRVSRKAARNVVFSGVGKRREELEAALRAGILLFNVESESELSLLGECANRVKRAAQVALRVNPDVPANTHPYISTGLRQHKFGIPIGQARALYSRARSDKLLKVRGVSVHIGSQITEVEPFSLALERVAELVRELRADGHTIDYVDAGGGLGIPYERSDGPDFSQYAQAVLRPLRGLRVHLLLEPGRAIVGPAGALVTRVLYRKSNHGKKFLIVDSAMNDFLRPSLYNAYHEMVPVQTAKSTETVDVVGPICETGDFFARDRELAVLEEGQLVAILDVGAYGMVLASNYNSRPRPAEVLVDGKSVRLIRRRETIEDLLREEH